MLPTAGQNAREVGQSTREAGSVAEGAMASVQAWALSYLSLQTAIQLVEELEEQTRKAIAARMELADEKLDVDKTLLPLMLNFGLNPDAAGQQKTRDIAFEFEKEAGTDLEQTKEILSQAQSVGFNVKNGPQDAGFAVAAEVGKFAARTGTDAETAGQLLKLARNAGVTDATGMDKLIAQLEAGFANTSISDPSGFYSAALRSITGRMVEGVPIDQAIGQVSAAALGEVNQRQIHTSVEILGPRRPREQGVGPDQGQGGPSTPD